ncbi:MAG: hypothetical protein ACREFH_13335, partial [Stellaceae bacterium]
MVTTSNIGRLYILATGDNLSEDCHACIGLVGFFVAEERSSGVQILNSEPSVEMGSWGKAPRGASLVKFGPQDFYGWILAENYMGQGVSYRTYAIYLPHGGGWKEVADIPAATDDSGARFDNLTTLKYKLKVDCSVP